MEHCASKDQAKLSTLQKVSAVIASQPILEESLYLKGTPSFVATMYTTQVLWPCIPHLQTEKITLLYYNHL